MPIFRKVVPEWQPTFETTDGSITFTGDYDSADFDEFDLEIIHAVEEGGEYAATLSLYKCLCKAMGLADHEGSTFDPPMDLDQDTSTPDAARKASSAARGDKYKMDPEDIKMSAANSIRSNAAQISKCVANFLWRHGKETVRVLDYEQATSGFLSGRAGLDIISPDEQDAMAAGTMEEKWGESEYVAGYYSSAAGQFVRKEDHEVSRGGYASVGGTGAESQTFLTYAAGEMEFQLDEDMFVEQKPVQAPPLKLKVDKYEPPT